MKKMKKQVLISIASYVLVIALIFASSILVSAAGSFKSTNDNYLKLRVDWETDYTSENDFVTVTAKVYLEHYSIFIGARNNGSVSINGEAITFSTPAINQEANTKKTPLIATHTVQIPYKPGETINADIYAKWHVSGIFNGKKIDWLEVSGKLTFNDSEATVTPGGNITDTNTGNTNNLDGNDSAMGGAVISQQDTIKSNTGTYINLRAVWNASDSLITDGKVTYVVSLYLDYYSLQMRARHGGKITVGDTVVSFNIPGIQETINSKHSILLATATYEATADEKVNISATMPYNGVYGGIKIEDIKLSSIISVK